MLFHLKKKFTSPGMDIYSADFLSSVEVITFLTAGIFEGLVAALLFVIRESCGVI